MMTRWIGLAGVAGAIALAAPLRADAPLKFEEVFSLVRSNLNGAAEGEINDLNRAAAAEFIDKLRGRVELTEGASAASRGSFISKTNTYDGIVYIRLASVGPGVASQIAETVKASPKAKGLILDLRFARGDDYGAAVDVVGLFLGSEHPILKWGDTVGKTSARGDVIDLPLVALVNHSTSGAAEALAATLRDQSLAILIGRPTAGQANVFQDFTLSGGQHLKIASSKVTLPDGKPIGAGGLAPDTSVEADEKNERRWLENPYLVIAKPGIPEGPAPFLTSVTNRFLHRPNAAEVGRRHREELEDDVTGGRQSSNTVGGPSKGPQVVQDAALARGIDFLKGLSVSREREARK